MVNTPKDGFPVFQDGDVEICLTRKPEDRFVLHSVVLGLHSPFFKISISERWSGRNDDAVSGDPIKWRYQLLFDEDVNDGVNDEEVPLLAKAKPEISSVSESSSLSPDTASIYLTHAPHVPSDESKTKSRLALIRAHRHYLETLYHKPLHFDTNKFPGLLKKMIHVLRLADAYGSLAIFQMPIETAFGQLKPDLDSLCGKHYFNIIYIATLARSAWLFQYVICRLVGDPTWADDRVRKAFATLGVASLVLEKRSQLRETMLRLDHIMTLEDVPVYNHPGVYGHTTILALAAYKLHLLQHIKKHDLGGWKLSSEKYRILKDQGESWPEWRYDALLTGFGPLKFNRRDFNAMIDCFREAVADHVSPLLIDHLDRDKTVFSAENAKRNDQGLTCVKITDDDLPWKDIPW